MKACAFVAFWGAFISLLSVAESLAQQTSTPKLEVIRGTGSAIILPRQAGSKDAPDVSSAITHLRVSKRPIGKLDQRTAISRGRLPAPRRR